MTYALSILLFSSVVAGPAASPDASDAASADEADNPAVLVEDMPDPHAKDWEPPPGPRRPPPPPVSSPAPSTQSPSNQPGKAGGPAQTAAPQGERVKVGQRLQVAGLVFGGAGIIGLAVGGYMFDQSLQTQRELNAERLFLESGASTQAEVAELEAALKDQRQVMTIALVAGGSSLTVAAILFITGTVTKRRAAAPTVSISGDTRFVGLTVSGRF